MSDAKCVVSSSSVFRTYQITSVDIDIGDDTIHSHTHICNTSFQYYTELNHFFFSLFWFRWFCSTLTRKLKYRKITCNHLITGTQHFQLCYGYGLWKLVNNICHKSGKWRRSRRKCRENEKRRGRKPSLSFIRWVCVCVLLQRVCAVKSAREEWPEIRRQILQRTFHLATPTCIRANKNWKRNFIETKSKYVTAENKSVVSFITLSLVLLSTFSAFIPPPHGANEIPNQFVDNKSFAMDWYRFIFLFFFLLFFWLALNLPSLVSDHFIYAILWKMKAVHTISDYIFRHQRCYWKTSTWKNTSETKIKIAAATKKQNRNENEISYNFDRIDRIE